MKFAMLAAAAIAATAMVMPVTAQEVITNPGKCAQYYPNANCQNYGPGNPYTGGGYRARYWGNSSASMGHRHWHHRGHYHHHHR